MRFVVATSSDLHVPAEAAWRAATSLGGIQAELPRPIRLRTVPSVSSLEEVLAADGPIVATLLLGPVPLLRWTPGIELLDVPGRRFVEASTDMTWMHRWRHERRVVDLGNGRSRIEDRVTGSSRVPFAGLLVRVLFAARHRRLRQRD